MYILHFYGRMLADTPRMNAYVEALRRSVTPDSVVLDLGSGPGVFALLACKFGARRVYAIEPDNTINIGREAAVAAHARPAPKRASSTRWMARAGWPSPPGGRPGRGVGNPP